MRRGDVAMIFGCLRYLYRNCKSIAQQNVTPAAVSFDLAKKQLALVIDISKTLHINILHLYITEKSSLLRQTMFNSSCIGESPLTKLLQGNPWWWCGGFKKLSQSRCGQKRTKQQKSLYFPLLLDTYKVR